MSTARRKATYQDILGLPDDLTGEIVGGELYTAPRPSTAHALAASHMSMVLGAPFDLGQGGPGGWWILSEPELHLDEDILVPDLGGWRRERVREFPDLPTISIAPDWVCEVLSPSTARKDRMIKLPRYAHHKVPWVWFVDPNLRQIEVFRLEAQSWILVGIFGDIPAGIAPFHALEIDWTVLWGGLGRKESP